MNNYIAYSLFKKFLDNENSVIDKRGIPFLSCKR